jgi:hypothetical protein
MAIMPIVFMRVSPSGKATASQAVIRGFESHHPLFTEKHPHNEVLFSIQTRMKKKPDSVLVNRRLSTPIQHA